ncbi:MAG: sigma-70 family RNA polymerase sigma factor [Solirubrobacteraceae bacterium]
MELTLRSARIAPELPEDVLVAAARQGEDQAFEELYARYRQRIFAFILSRVRDHGRAEDIAQDVFISALRRLRASDQQISFKPWIYEIAKNACIDEFRRGSRSREIPLETDEEVTGRRPMISIVPTPSDAVENRQRLDDLRGAFGGLSESHHQLLVLREFEGLSYDEIGERLGMTRQMVESGLFRARRKLTEEYDDLASGRRCVQIQTAIDSGSAQSITSLGVRERRRIARHLSHCQSCRHGALVAGVDEALLKPKSIASKIAGLLPFPVWRWLRRGGNGQGVANAGARGASRHLSGASLRGAVRVVHPAGSSASLGQAAVTLATLALAGAGTGLVVGLDHPHSSGSSATLAAAIVNPSGATTKSMTTTAARPATGWPRSATTASAKSAVARFLTIGPAGVVLAPVQVLVPSATAQGKRLAPSSSGTSSTGPANSPSAANSINVTTASAQSGLLGKVDGTVSGATQTLHSALGGVTSGLKSTLGGVKSAVSTTTSGVKKTVSTVTSGINGAAGSAVSGVTGGAGSTRSASSSSSTGSVTSGGSSGSQSAGSLSGTSPGAGSLKSVGAKLTGGGSSSASTSSAPSSPVASVLAPVKSTVSGVVHK